MHCWSAAVTVPLFKEKWEPGLGVAIAGWESEFLDNG